MALKKHFAYSILILIAAVMTFLAAELAIVLFKNSAKNKYFEPVKNNELLKYDAVMRQQVKDKQISSETFNIYYFGESTMEGAPYRDTIPILVEKMIDGKVEGKPLKWINMGVSGISYSIVADQIRQIVNQKDIFYPRLVIIYSGHNEYLPYHGEYGFNIADAKKQKINWLLSRSQIADVTAKKLKLYKLEIDDRSYFDKPLFSDEKYVEVITNFQKEIDKTIDYLKKNNVPVIVSTVAGNYSDFEPNRSVYNCNEAEKIIFKKKMDSGDEMMKNNMPDKAVGFYVEARAICSSFAQTSFKLGKAYEKLGKYEEAWRAYGDAVDCDKMPIRTMSLQNQFIKKIEESKTVKIADAVEYLREHSPARLIGYNFMSDGHHPNLEGHLLISELLAKKIGEIFDDAKLKPLSLAQADVIFNQEDGLMTMLTSRAEWLFRLATWTYNPAERLEKADEYLDLAIEKHPDWARMYLDKMTIMYLKKENEKANEFYKIAENLDKKTTEEYINNVWINQIIYRALAEKKN